MKRRLTECLLYVCYMVYGFWQHSSRQSLASLLYRRGVYPSKNILTYPRSQVCLYGVHLEFNSNFFLKNIYLAASGLSWSTWVLAVAVHVRSGWVAPRLVGIWALSSPTRAQTHILCIARQILNLWTTREVPLRLLRLDSCTSCFAKCCLGPTSCTKMTSSETQMKMLKIVTQFLLFSVLEEPFWYYGSPKFHTARLQ